MTLYSKKNIGKRVRMDICGRDNHVRCFVPRGTMGKIIYVVEGGKDSGCYTIKWENGQSCNIIYSHDRFTLNPRRSYRTVLEILNERIL